jgi:hypothetical protein
MVSSMPPIHPVTGANTCKRRLAYWLQFIQRMPINHASGNPGAARHFVIAWECLGQTYGGAAIERCAREVRLRSWQSLPIRRPEREVTRKRRISNIVQ